MAVICHRWQIRVNPYFDAAVVCQSATMPDVQRLLALANGAALHKALRDAGYPAKYRTVARWVQTRQVPPDMEQAVLEAFGLGQAETPPPWWAEASGQLVDQIEGRMKSTAVLADPVAEALAAAIVPDVVRALRQSGEAAPSEAEAPPGVADKPVPRPQ